jgi:SNF2 family DNA or RNA helicase
MTPRPSHPSPELTPYSTDKHLVKGNCKVRNPWPLILFVSERLIRPSHLDGSMEAIKYHGPKRKEIIKKIEHFDIVITTYSTLAKEHGGEKGGRNKSPLHNFAWYRVVLDEGRSKSQALQRRTRY